MDLSILPPELIGEILSHILDDFSARLVCRAWAAICRVSRASLLEPFTGHLRHLARQISAGLPIRHNPLVVETVSASCCDHCGERMWDASVLPPTRMTGVYTPLRSCRWGDAECALPLYGRVVCKRHGTAGDVHADRATLRELFNDRIECLVCLKWKATGGRLNPQFTMEELRRHLTNRAVYVCQIYLKAPHVGPAYEDRKSWPAIEH